MKTIKITNDEYDYLYSALTLNIMKLESMLLEAHNTYGQEFIKGEIEKLCKIQDKLRESK